MTETIDHYAALGVSRGATDEEIQVAYRKAAMLNHPDRKSADPEAPAKFRAAKNAKDCLRDREKREFYDKHGTNPDPSSIEDRGRSHLLQKFDMALTEGAVDPVAWVRQMVLADRSGALVNISEAERMIRSCEKQRRKTRTKDGGPNLFLMLIEGRVEEIKRQIELMRGNLKIAEAALQQLANYEAVPKVPPVPSAPSFAAEMFGLTGNWT